MNELIIIMNDIIISRVLNRFNLRFQKRHCLERFPELGVTLCEMNCEKQSGGKQFLGEPVGSNRSEIAEWSS